MKLGVARLVELVRAEEKRPVRGVDFFPIAALDRVEEALDIIGHVHVEPFGKGVDEVAAVAAELHEFRGDDFVRRRRRAEAGTGASSKMRSGSGDRSPRSAGLSARIRRTRIGGSLRLIYVAQEDEDDHEHGAREDGDGHRKRAGRSLGIGLLGPLEVFITSQACRNRQWKLSRICKVNSPATAASR